MLDWILLGGFAAIIAVMWWRIDRLEKRLERVSTRLRAIHDDTSHQHRALEVRLDRILEYIDQSTSCDRAA
ncbi:hypothetical protein [Pelagibius sp. Alg239-R121]|uniref:hypothetical protein n=1 Tax=Pelagibius sp. Alg239-R121 TaxID=2993448 RepID=UPI0024A63127|nr:hypothetical protein [Pelagibius sp. Alg239-R121]